MTVERRIDLLQQLRNYIIDYSNELKQICIQAEYHNGWFTQNNISKALHEISSAYLDRNALQQIVDTYTIKVNNSSTIVGLVMAGNIPLVGFHDFLCVFISGHKLMIKTSTKDQILIKHFVQKLIEWEPLLKNEIVFSDMLKGCDAYIATGSNNSARYFEHYFSKYPHIIRKNKTSVAVLDNTETTEELEALADDVYLYFGLGCRNVTKIYVPYNYAFETLLTIFRKYHEVKNHSKYANNLDYNLALYILNNQYYMSNESLLLVENSSLFSPIAVLHFEYYNNKNEVYQTLALNPDIQAIIGHHAIAFGKAQKPSITDYADGIDTMQFLVSL